MSSEEQQKFRLDNSLNGTSEVIHKIAMYRIYGDKAPEVIDGLKKTPHVAIPLVLKRLKSKDEEWRTAQKAFNKIWREQNEKYYLKSLDHQGLNFKQADQKAMKSKMLIREIEQIFEEKSDQMEDGNAEPSGPHLSFTYQDKSMLDDAASLIIHHMKRQAGIHKDDKTKIKSLLLHFIQDLFFAPRGDVSDDDDSTKDEDIKKSEKPQISNEMDDVYNLLFTNNTWYIFLRLHQMLCERLGKMYQQAMKIAEFEAHDKQYRREGTAIALRLKRPDATDVEEYYPAFLDMVKNLLDGQLEPNQFDDTLREMFGVHAYISFTIDKLIVNIVRQLHNLVTDDLSIQITDLFKQEQLNGGTGGPAATITARTQVEYGYQKKAETILVDENCFKILFHKEKSSCRVSIELLPTDDDQSEDQVEVEKWSEYVEKYVSPDSDIIPELKEHLTKKPIFLIRNSRLLDGCTSELNSKKNTPMHTSAAMEVKMEVDEAEANVPDDEKKELEPTVSTTLKEEDMEDEPFPDIKTAGNVEIKIGANYKMRYVSGTWESMYRRNALSRARQSHPKTNMKLHKNFQAFHNQWLSENVSRDQGHIADDWFNGKATEAEDFLPCLTTKDSGRSGGLNINRYSVVYTKDLKEGPATLPPKTTTAS